MTIGPISSNLMVSPSFSSGRSPTPVLGGRTGMALVLAGALLPSLLPGWDLEDAPKIHMATNDNGFLIIEAVNNK